MSAAAEPLSSDEQLLADLGYKQELKRGWSGFSNFAISFSIISILSGCFTSYGQAFNNGGPIAISIGWPIISLLVLCVAFSMAELASAMPTSGGIYYWASKLGGPGWGWFTGWFNLIGLIAVVASVDYAASGFLSSLFGLMNIDFIFNFTSTNVHYAAHVTFALFLIILILHGLINVFSSHLVSLFNATSVWWHLIGAAVIVVVLIVAPAHHASAAYVFGHRAFGSFNHGMFWFYVLPLGFLLTMYTITGYDASAHVSEETHNAAEAAPRGVYRSVIYSAIAGYILLLAITFAVPHSASAQASIGDSAWPSIAVLTSALSATAAKLLIAISVVGQLFCGMACVTSASRMTFAFSRDGAVPGHGLWRRLGANKTPTWAVGFVCVFSAIITIPAFFPDSAGYPVAFFAVTSMAVIGLYIAYTIPVYLRWRMADRFKPGPWTLGAKYKWVNLIAVIWVALCVIIFCLPTADPGGVFFKHGFSWSSVNYAPIVTLAIMAVVTIWYLVSARKTFTGPIHTFEDPEVVAVVAGSAP